jgi:formylglycine-generating enzyme required for sulfatase activity
MDKTYFKKQFVALPDSLKSKSKWACKTEVSNAEYQTFLNEVKDSAFAIKSSNWSAYFKYRYYQMYGVNNGFSNYPVVNITYEAAVAYCNWLTQKYNSINGRTYKQVKFRLPNNDEWELAASGGHKGFHFPWGGPYLRNSVGCYLANFSPLEDRFLYRKKSVLKYNYPDDDITISRGIDGAIIPSTVTSYFPNDIGLFNCSGNVSEMLNIKYQAKGGSWFSGYQTLLIRSNEIYTSENPLTGFRVFMEVIEK